MTSSNIQIEKQEEIIININDEIVKKYDELLIKMNDIIKKNKKLLKTK